MIRAKLAEKEAKHAELEKEMETILINMPLAIAAVKATGNEANQEEIKKELLGLNNEIKKKEAKLKSLGLQVTSLKKQFVAVHNSLQNPQSLSKKGIFAITGISRKLSQIQMPKILTHYFYGKRD
jgi:hypothetical protein